MPRTRGRSKTIDTVHWTAFAGAAAALASGSAVAVLLSVAQHLPETLLRIRGEWVASLDGQIGAQGGAAVTAGIILVPEGTGTTVLWEPGIDGDAPWIWWDHLTCQYEEAVLDVVASTGMVSSGRRVMDSKAMRKVRNSELQVVFANAATSGFTTAAVNVSMVGRFLSGS